MDKSKKKKGKAITSNIYTYQATEESAHPLKSSLRDHNFGTKGNKGCDA
jgi:hypothetical protein